MTTALLYTGGMDSFLYWRLLGRPRTVYVKLGHRYQERELQAIHDLEALAHANGDARAAPHPMILDGPDLSQWEAADSHIPHRNLTLATVAAMICDRVLFGFLAGESSEDKSARFLRHTSRALSTAAGHKVAADAPLRSYTKDELLARFLDEPGVTELDINLVRQTRSCWSAGQPCGECVPCFRRWVALTLNGQPPDETAKDPRIFGIVYTSPPFPQERARKLPRLDRRAHWRKEAAAKEAIEMTASPFTPFPGWAPLP